jgi:NAD(P)-dependent dehydrogenase (short-subunit alcohol dehydrogenase family)
MPKKICLITGATEGVGKATAVELARKGFTVVLAARNAARAEMVKKEIAVSTGNTDIDFIIADLASLKQVRHLADTFKQRYASLDVLINNAGVLVPRRILTEDGYETTFQVNYLSHFLLTQLLLDHLLNSGQGRIINLGSSVYTIGTFDKDNLQGEKQFAVLAAYAASKLFVLMFTLELARRLRDTPVTANVVHPGIVRTPMMLRAPGLLLRTASYLAFPFAVSPQKGAATSVYLASSQEVKDVSGQYFVRCKPVAVQSKFNSESDRVLLWNISMKCLKTGSSGNGTTVTHVGGA